MANYRAGCVKAICISGLLAIYGFDHLYVTLTRLRTTVVLETQKPGRLREKTIGIGMQLSTSYMSLRVELL